MVCGAVPISPYAASCVVIPGAEVAMTQYHQRKTEETETVQKNEVKCSVQFIHYKKCLSKIVHLYINHT